ncbi:MAG: glycosyltransferase family 4 protein [Planctomycetota bacterium]|jgi:glycosyltransferase involved in cell wall biosynthesis
MKVLVVTASYPPEIGGIAAHCHHLCRTLASHGHRVRAVALCRNVQESSVTDEDGVEVHRLRWHHRIGPVRYSAGKFRLRRAVAGLLKKDSYDVVHIHGHGYEARATRKLPRRTPLVGTMHSSIYLAKAATARGRRILKRALGRLDVVTAPSTEICEVTDSLGLPAGACVFVPNAVDTDVFRPGVDGEALAREFGVDRARPVVVCARRMAPKNGVIYFARAVKAILERHPEALFVFAGAGDPEYTNEVMAVIRQDGVLDSCRFPGVVPNDRMPGVMSLADVSVLPSLVEATSITGLESMAAGLPVVGTNVGGIPEIVSDDAQGLLVPPADPEALAEAVSRVLSDKGLASRLGAAARERAVKEFSWDRITARFEELYAEAASRRESAQA